MGLARLAACLVLVALPAQAERLMCLGQQPRFTMMIEADRVAFDFLGDGEFGLAPPLASRDFAIARHDLKTSGAVWPMVLETRPCAALGMRFPVVMQILPPEASDGASYLACCIWQSGG